METETFVKIYLSRDADGQFQRIDAGNQREASSQVSLRTPVRTFSVPRSFANSTAAFDGFVRQLAYRLIWETESCTFDKLTSSAREEIDKLNIFIRVLQDQGPIADDFRPDCDHSFLEDEYGITECEKCGAYDVVSSAAMSIVTARRRSKAWDKTKDRLTVVKECNRLKANFTESLLTASTSIAARLMANG